MFEQPFLAPNLSSIADEFAVFADYPVAGDNDGDWVSIVGQAYCSGGLWITDTFGDVSIASGCSEGQFAEFGPNALLEWGSGSIEGCFEVVELPLEIKLQLTDCAFDVWIPVSARRVGFRI